MHSTLVHTVCGMRLTYYHFNSFMSSFSTSTEASAPAVLIKSDGLFSPITFISSYFPSGRDLLDRCPVSDHVYVTTLLVLPGYFWVGTSVGIIMVYRIPLIEGVPIITAKPYLAMDGHKGQVQYDSSVLVVITITVHIDL